MKIIHCADVHLDAAMKRHLDKEQSKQRKNELLLTFENMVEYAKQHQVDAIMIAGDLFDTANVTKKTGNVVLNCIRQAPQIDFFYLKGNHDNFGFFESLEETLPKNLKLFSEQWRSYRYPEATITGVELTPENLDTIYQQLILDYDEVNLVMLHGQEGEYGQKQAAQIIVLPELKNKYIDYLALGHVHTYKEAPLDARGVYCYSGCLEGRGFDECGLKGFVLLDIHDGTITREFIPFAKRQIHEIMVDVSACKSSDEIADCITQALQEVFAQDLVRVVLTGRVVMGSERNLSYLTEKFSGKYYAFTIKDKTLLEIHPEEFQNDVSLKGEFIRLCMEQNIDPEQQKAVIELGIHALLGEEI